MLLIRRQTFATIRFNICEGNSRIELEHDHLFEWCRLSCSNDDLQQAGSRSASCNKRTADFVERVHGDNSTTVKGISVAFLGNRTNQPFAPV